MKKRPPKPTSSTAIAPGPQAPLVDLGRKVAVQIKKASAENVVFTLDDGTLLQIKPVLMGIERSLQKYNALGDPIYQFQAGMMINTVVSRKLKRKTKK